MRRAGVAFCRLGRIDLLVLFLLAAYDDDLSLGALQQPETKGLAMCRA
jgi:hypothetical protein